MKQQNLQKIAQDAANYYYETITQFTTDSWRKAMQNALDMDLPAHIIGALVFESLFMSERLFYEQAKKHFTEEELKRLGEILHNNIVMLLAEMYFDSDNKINDMDAHYEEVEDMYDDFRGDHLGEYMNSPKKELVSVFADLLMENFITQEIPISPQVLQGYAENVIEDIKEYDILN